MKVVMLKITNYGGVKQVGQEYEIDDAVAKRWIERKLAEPVSDAFVLEEDDKQFIPYTDMEPKALIALCKERKVELNKELLKSFKSNDERKEYVIGMLEADDKAKATNGTEK